ADLLRALEGYDLEIAGMGEDVDLSWRAHAAGARVVVAPAARARHLALVANGRRSPAPTDAPSLQALQRRNELAAVLACYTGAHLVRVLPQAVLLALGELAVAAAYRDRRRARAVLHAWRWNLADLGRVRRRRAALRAVRVLPDADLRELQVRGSARLSTFLSRLTAHGLDAAHTIRGAGHRAAAEWGAEVDAPAQTAGTKTFAEAGAAGRHMPRPTSRIGFAEDADYNELDDLGRRGSLPVHRPGRLLASGRSRLVAGLVAAGVLAIGSRHLLGDPLPMLGQFLPFPSWISAWHHLFGSWQSTGTGTSAPASPAFGVLAVLGTALFGRMGLLQEALVFGCLPIGAWGVSRLLGAFGSARARLVGALAYLALPLAYDALARGRWDGLVAYAATPWLVGQLARSTGLAPFDGAARGTVGRWRATLAGRMVVVGATEALAMSFAPAFVVVVGCCALGIGAGCLLTGSGRSAWRAPVVGVGATVVACVLCAPWVIGTLGAGRSLLSVFGLPGTASAAPGWGGLLRLAVGPVGHSPLAWLLLAAAFAPLLLAHRERLAWAVRCWAVLLVSALVALVSAKVLAGAFAPSVDVVLAPVGAGIAACVGIGIAAFEQDLSGYRFGWRQVLAPVAACAVALGMLPVVAAAAGGRWDLPAVGYAGAAQLQGAGTSASYRVLWIGNPDALPSGGWSIGAGLAYATSVDGTPQLGALWPSPSAGRARLLGQDMQLAMRGETVDLGRLLAHLGVRDVVVVRSLAPKTPGSASPGYPLPVGLVAALSRQEDLRTEPLSVSGLVVFRNAAVVHRASGDLAAPATVGGAAGLLDPLGGALELVLWAIVAAALLGRRRWLDWWWQPLQVRQRDRRRVQEPVLVPPVAVGADLRPVEDAAVTGAPVSPAPAGDLG
ncbi:MAG: hypothetical protein ACRDWE_01715, partial [Acidimicrobiales bacterium]